MKLSGKELLSNSQPMIFAYNLFMLAALLSAIFLFRRKSARYPFLWLIVFGFLLGFVGFVGSLFTPIDPFGKIKLQCWTIFLYFPLYLAGAAGVIFKKRRVLALLSIVIVLGVLAVGVDAFLIEPKRLEVTHLTIASDKIQKPLRIAVLADIQTDDPGAYEENVFRLLAAEKPDLILFAGDYVQTSPNSASYEKLQTRLNEIIRQADLTAPLEAYAVEGINIDRPGWQKTFDSCPVTTVDATTTIDLGQVVLTALSMNDSGNPALVVDASEKFHIVLGHRPDYALGRVDANLLLAGHTHGGQIQLPFIGPVMTLSQVPRKWASGRTELGWRKTLIVSRGIGLERGSAPPIRFLCRPQLVIIDLAPAR